MTTITKPTSVFKPAPSRQGLVLVAVLIIVGLAIAASGEGSVAGFFNLPAFALVVGGTAAATLVSSPGADLRDAVACARAAMTTRHQQDPAELARSLSDLARAVRDGGVLALEARAADPSLPLYLRRGLELAADGMPEEEVDTLLRLEAHAAMERARQPAAIFRRAADCAPAMGLIGTLIGLIQMLGRLNEPSAIGPSLAVALLTTFYGAVLANVVLNPLAAKLDRQAAADVMRATMIRYAVLLIIRREHPARIEIMLNSILPPDRQLDPASSR